MSKLYEPHVVQSRIDELQGGDEDDEDGNFNASYGEVFFSPLYQRATFLGIFMAIAQ